MSTIPKTRAQLVEDLAKAFDRLTRVLDEAGASVGSRPCVDDWSVKDLLAVRVWWSEAVVEWVDAGLLGENVELPARGYRWNETPRLNDDTVRRQRRTSLRRLRQRLAAARERLGKQVDSLNDRQLFEPGAFEWTGSYSVARLIAMNTTRQYRTAATLIAKAARS